MSTQGALPGAVMPPYCVIFAVQPSSAQVAGGGDDDDAGVDRALGGERQRVGLVRFGDAPRPPTG